MKNWIIYRLKVIEEIFVYFFRDRKIPPTWLDEAGPHRLNIGYIEKSPWNQFREWAKGFRTPQSIIAILAIVAAILVAIYRTK